MTNENKGKTIRESSENHQTAAWACHTIKTKPESNVPIPCGRSVIDAKDYVDTNQK